MRIGRIHWGPGAFVPGEEWMTGAGHEAGWWGVSAVAGEAGGLMGIGSTSNR